MIIDISTHRFSRKINIVLRFLFEQIPVVFVRSSEGTFFFSFLVYFNRAIVIKVGSNNEITRFSPPVVQWNFTCATIYPTIFQTDCIPNLTFFIRSFSLYLYNFQRVKSNFFIRIFNFFFTAQLVVPSFLIEVKYKPS